MTVITKWFTTEPGMGVDLMNTWPTVNTVAASGTSSTGNLEEANMPGDTLGTMREGNGGSVWVLVKASSTVTQYNVVVIDPAFNANNATSALMIGTPNLIGLAQFSATQADPGSNPVFWAAIKGDGLQVNVSGSAGTGAAVNNGTVAGSVSISTTGTTIHGLTLAVSAGASGVVECVALYPRNNVAGGLG